MEPSVSPPSSGVPWVRRERYIHANVPLAPASLQILFERLPTMVPLGYTLAGEVELAAGLVAKTFESFLRQWVNCQNIGLAGRRVMLAEVTSIVDTYDAINVLNSEKV